MKKSILILALTATVTGSFSCKKYLELTPKTAIPANDVIKDATSAEQALRGTYREVGGSGYIGGGGSFLETVLLAGGDVNFNNVGEALNVLNYKFRSDNPFFTTAWAGLYSTINRANNVIYYTPQVTDVTFTEVNKNRVIGEALFIRGMAYFDLARGWGGVPLKLLPTEDLNNLGDISRSTLQETYAQVEADLTSALSLLPDVVNRNRATKNTVHALLARLYLYQSRWTEAETEASLLIGNTQYQLLTPFNTWVKGDIGTKESIFELEHSAQNPNLIRNEMQHTTRGGQYSISPNSRAVALLRDPAIGGLPTGRRSLIDSLTQAGNTIWFGSLYYRSPAIDPNYILRIAEQYLIRAEARVKRNNLSGAKEDLNAIRQRAGLALFTDAQLTTPDEILLAIENERRFEFLWEPDRWFNLVRTGRAKAALEADNADRSIDNYKLLFPIPNDETILGHLTQNPGY